MPYWESTADCSDNHNKTHSKACVQNWESGNVALLATYKHHRNLKDDPLNGNPRINDKYDGLLLVAFK
jgi:hypothetical protein